MRDRKMAVILGVILLVAAGVGGWQWWQWRHPHLVLDPHAKIDANRTYPLEIWVEMGGELVTPPSLDDEFWSEITSAFQSVYPNTQISFKPIEQANLEQAMQKAMDWGRPPHILVESSRWFRVWSDLQLPIDRFLMEDERGQYFTGALAQVAVGEHLMAWPSLIQPRVWVANGRIWNQLGSEMSQMALEFGDAATWTKDGWRDTKDRLSKTAKLPLPVVAQPKGVPDTLIQILVAVSGGIVSPTGELLLTEELIKVALDQWQAQQNDKFMSLVQGTLLTDFLSGRKAIIGPLGLWIWSLGENAKVRGYRSLNIPEDVILLPAPGGASSGGYLGGTMVQVAVFRHRRFQGQAHARLAMELARDLSRKLGLEMGRKSPGVPAYKALLEEWQLAADLDAKQRDNLVEVLEQAQGLQPLPLQWHTARRLLIEQILEPGLDDFVNGRSGVDLAGKLASEMNRLLEDVRSLASKGKRR